MWYFVLYDKSVNPINVAVCHRGDQGRVSELKAQGFTIVGKSLYEAAKTKLIETEYQRLTKPSEFK